MQQAPWVCACFSLPLPLSCSLKAILIVSLVCLPLANLRHFQNLNQLAFHFVFMSHQLPCCLFVLKYLNYYFSRMEFIYVIVLLNSRATLDPCHAQTLK